MFCLPVHSIYPHGSRLAVVEQEEIRRIEIIDRASMAVGDADRDNDQGDRGAESRLLSAQMDGKQRRREQGWKCVCGETHESLLLHGISDCLNEQDCSDASEAGVDIFEEGLAAQAMIHNSAEQDGRQSDGQR